MRRFFTPSIAQLCRGRSFLPASLRHVGRPQPIHGFTGDLQKQRLLSPAWSGFCLRLSQQVSQIDAPSYAGRKNSTKTPVSAKLSPERSEFSESCRYGRAAAKIGNEHQGAGEECLSNAKVPIMEKVRPVQLRLLQRVAWQQLRQGTFFIPSICSCC